MRALPRPTRRDDRRVVAGVAAGLGDYLGLDPNLVRLAFAVLAFAGGLGVFAYLAAWTVMPAAAPAGHARSPRDSVDVVQAFALALVVVGGLLLARTAGLWLGDALVWPLVLAAFGLGLLWMRPPRDDGRLVAEWPWLERFPPSVAEAVAVVLGTRRGALARAFGGVALVAGGIALFLASAGSWEALRGGLLAGAVVAAGIALAIGPALLRLGRELVEERRERIRSEERADVAAHLHDSVLQTLALVQRRADDPREVVRLARRQERELRAWLLGGDAESAPPATSLGRALEAAAAEIEEEGGVPVEVVRVRDCPLDGMEPLLLASREAMLNAARHSGAPTVSVYLEVEPDRATVFVRDRGRGFEPASVPAGRGGIAAAIVGRMARRGGTATVRSAPGDGTEVELVLPRGSEAGGREPEPARPERV